MSPAVSAQQIIFSPGTHYLLRLFALLSSEACVTPTIHTYIHTSPNTGNGYHSNQDPDLFASFSSLTSKRPIHFSHGKKCITLKSLINSAQLWELWGNKEKAKLVVSPDEHETRTHSVQWGTSFQPGSFHWLDRGHWQFTVCMAVFKLSAWVVMNYGCVVCGSHCWPPPFRIHISAQTKIDKQPSSV